jgi:hypothetical protein
VSTANLANQMNKTKFSLYPEPEPPTRAVPKPPRGPVSRWTSRTPDDLRRDQFLLASVGLLLIDSDDGNSIDKIVDGGESDAARS